MSYEIIDRGRHIRNVILPGEKKKTLVGLEALCGRTLGRALATILCTVYQ